MIDLSCVGFSPLAIYREILATQLAIHLLRRYCTFSAKLKRYDNGLSDRQIRVITDYVESYLETNIALKDLASLVGLSNHYFCHLFKQSTGIAPYQYVIQQRIIRAKRVLKRQDLSLVDVALASGFISQSAFNLTFKRMSVLPSESIV